MLPSQRRYHSYQIYPKVEAVIFGCARDGTCRIAVLIGRCGCLWEMDEVNDKLLLSMGMANTKSQGLTGGVAKSAVGLRIEFDLAALVESLPERLQGLFGARDSSPNRQLVKELNWICRRKCGSRVPSSAFAFPRRCR
jgi:hypothetical protein